MPCVRQGNVCAALQPETRSSRFPMFRLRALPPESPGGRLGGNGPSGGLRLHCPLIGPLVISNFGCWAGSLVSELRSECFPC